MATGEGTEKVRIPIGLDVSLEPLVDLVIEVQLLGRIGFATTGRRRPTHANSPASRAPTSTTIGPPQVWQCAVHFRMMVMKMMRRRHSEDLAINVLRMARSMR